ncbi:hypothetical protein A2303_01225 [Candidatus Falkowbacteria bacterium RIFOXYB2_FULL_47_14]|uniref:Uncharacterized protein n=1 Tax=Candidatus Falkowbacteria bacterium RIFOXYA2_FULL_47_19 TaxID=1797994 RepID=A0A1F5SJX6_9BACT|nr:MAG: hypothetical protein A2227_06065 [Candidatus Falkowbacteria bacterium RIFOXYA2_FULL_47_19]OGF34473.1 MAG: hypothetical protein A2468_04565 [Candidatus Falkowbacteria bacterium RIFOXYC2_FULL_46_15]OGF43512.1 MAG: hypothetical protein A2303_01225 [Candidatus Falkowbacteria bacterium RIFOXYB2_FULL_47_14]
MKNQIISVFLTVILAGAAIVGGAYALKSFKPESAVPGEPLPEKTVLDFYSVWAGYEGNPMLDRIYRESALLTPACVNKIDAVLDTSLAQGGFDPVLCSQDIPEGLNIADTEISDDLAVVTVLEAFSGGDKIFDIRLVKINGDWKIDEIACGGVSAGALIPAGTEDLVGDYIRENINELSLEKAVLGGTFRLGSVKFTGPDTCVVEYEDGHIALTAQASFRLSAEGEVEIVSFDIIEEPGAGDVPAEEDSDLTGREDAFCVDKCGNGECEEIVCLAEGCPCAETPTDCPEDCGAY